MIDLASVIRPGDGIIWGQACAEPQTLVEALVSQRSRLGGVAAFLGSNYAGIIKPVHADHLSLSSYCGTGANRALADAGVLRILRVPYSQLGPMIRAREIRADVVMLQVSPPNATGEYSLGLAADYLVPALATARVVIAEVNAQVPWTHSGTVLREENFTLRIESSRPPASPPPARRGALEAAIARHAAPFIAEGATLEFGIGALPEAVCTALAARRDLKVHSGTVGDGVAELVRSGAVSSVDCAMLIGSPSLFDLARENPAIRLHSCEYTHGANVLAGIERFVAINSAVEVDHGGQVNAEVARGSYVGAIGGAPDFVHAANRSPGGVSLLLIPASRIVPALSAPATLPAEDAGVVVTERGAADLRGHGRKVREKRLRAISEIP
ncbi:MAG TPA: acetyl-CoA hydrolase/transferase C-terminal domain-containing protein [Burkholderiales bacterium]